jgi:hypothetical protein
MPPQERAPTRNGEKRDPTDGGSPTEGEAERLKTREEAKPPSRSATCQNAQRKGEEQAERDCQAKCEETFLGRGGGSPFKVFAQRHECKTGRLVVHCVVEKWQLSRTCALSRIGRCPLLLCAAPSRSLAVLAAFVLRLEGQLERAAALDELSRDPARVEPWGSCLMNCAGTNRRKG